MAGAADVVGMVGAREQGRREGPAQTHLAIGHDVEESKQRAEKEVLFDTPSDFPEVGESGAPFRHAGIERPPQQAAFSTRGFDL